MDFVKWKYYIDEIDLNGFHREDYFLAQIAQYITKTNSKNPNNVDLKPFLLKFTQEKPKTEKQTKDDVRRKMAMSRAAWSGFIGVAIPMDDLKVPDSDDGDYEDSSDVDGIGA